MSTDRKKLAEDMITQVFSDGYAKGQADLAQKLNTIIQPMLPSPSPESSAPAPVPTDARFAQMRGKPARLMRLREYIQSRYPEVVSLKEITNAFPDIHNAIVYDLVKRGEVEQVGRGRFRWKPQPTGDQSAERSRRGS